MMSGLFKSVRAIALAAVVGAIAGPSCAAADIQVLSQNDTSLSVKFIDAGNNQTTLNFTRPDTNSNWSGPTGSGAPGVTFGNTSPLFASTAQLRALGISPTQAVQTFDTSITARPMDDITIVQTITPGAYAVLLWQDELVSEIWYVGVMVSHLLDDELSESTCESSTNWCCNTQQVPPPGTGTAPNPDYDNCMAVFAHCTSVYKDAACDCLYATCTLCDPPTPAPECTLVPDPALACTIHTSVCNPGSPPTNIVGKLLGEILDRVQVIYDTR